jgi:hypothetical protein
VDATLKNNLKIQLLLTGQASDRYWTDAWNLYNTTPTVINFNIQLNLVDAALISINDKFKNQTIEFNGNLTVDFVSFPLNYSIQLP